MAAAKAVTDAAVGGMVLMSDASCKQLLPSLAKLPCGPLLVYGGEVRIESLAKDAKMTQAQRAARLESSGGSHGGHNADGPELRRSISGRSKRQGSKARAEDAKEACGSAEAVVGLPACSSGRDAAGVLQVFMLLGTDLQPRLGHYGRLRGVTALQVGWWAVGGGCSE